jgi:glycosyltransferase involved in cell wall biosynthesis
MNVLILIKKYSGGVGVVVKNIKKNLEKKGHKIKIISRQEDLKINSFKNSIFKIRKIVKKEMKENKYDIIYTQDWSLSFPLLFPIKLYSTKHFCCFHGIQPGFPKIFQKFVGNLMKEKLIVVGDSLKKKFSESNLIYNGVDINLFKPNKKTKRIKNSVGFANWKIKRYHYNKIKKAVESSGKKLIIAEKISYEKMPEFYNSLGMFISLPPSCTGFNMVWVEAMACDVPKIIGNDAGIGSKLPINKIDNFENIKSAIINAKKKNYRELLNRNFTWDFHTNKLLELWKNEKIKRKL